MTLCIKKSNHKDKVQIKFSKGLIFPLIVYYLVKKILQFMDFDTYCGKFHELFPYSDHVHHFP